MQNVSDSGRFREYAFQFSKNRILAIRPVIGLVTTATTLEGNHGEDVKEYYFYLDSTPTHSYMKALYKYPQGEFPYRRLVEENRRRNRTDFEYELLDTGAFDENRYFTEYAKSSAEDILIRIIATKRGPARADLSILPTIWFRNTWSWGRDDYRPAVR